MALYRSGGQVRIYVIGSAQTMLACSRKLPVTGAREGLMGEVSLKLSLEK